MADHTEHSEHIVSAKLYWLIWFLLIIGTVVTALVATVDLGTFHGIDFNTVVALLIATCKASIVVLIFMNGSRYIRGRDQQVKISKLPHRRVSIEPMSQCRSLLGNDGNALYLEAFEYRSQFRRESHYTLAMPQISRPQRRLNARRHLWPAFERPVQRRQHAMIGGLLKYPVPTQFWSQCSRDPLLDPAACAQQLEFMEVTDRLGRDDLEPRSRRALPL